MTSDMASDMTVETEPPQPDAAHPATRKRGDVLVSAVFQVVLDLLHESDYGDITMESVAARAHTGKAALYRRWANKDALVYAALESTLPRPEEVPIHDTVRADLLDLLNCAAQTMRLASGAAFHTLKAAAGDGASRLHHMIKKRVSEPVRTLTLEALRRGAERGEVRPAAVTEQIATVPYAMLTYYCVTVRTDVPVDYLTSIIDNVVLPIIRP
jgi:AcrR family transcriptional regulator